MRFMLFEEFINTDDGKVEIANAQNKITAPAPNPLSPSQVFNLLHILSQASAAVKSISRITKAGNTSTFAFVTTQPNDDMDGDISYKVTMKDTVASLEVEMLGGDKSFRTTIEIAGENDIEVIANNYIEATNIYYDGPINSITNDILSIKSVEDVKRIVKDQNTSKSTDDADVKDTKERIKLKD